MRTGSCCAQLPNGLAAAAAATARTARRWKVGRVVMAVSLWLSVRSAGNETRAPGLEIGEDAAQVLLRVRHQPAFAIEERGDAAQIHLRVRHGRDVHRGQYLLD